MLWCGDSWVKRLRFWFKWGVGVDRLLGSVKYFSPDKEYLLPNLSTTLIMYCFE